MRFRLSLGLMALLVLAGCSTVSAVRDAWTWDPTALQQPARAVLTAEEQGALASRVAQLKVQRDEIRSRISAAPDVWARQRLYEELHGVGRQLSPLERQVAAAAPAH